MCYLTASLNLFIPTLLQLLDPSSDVKEELPGLAILIPKYYKDPSVGTVKVNGQLCSYLFVFCITNAEL